VRVVAMFRVSTEKQANEGASLDAQERQYHELAKRMHWRTVATFRGCESATQASKERAVLQNVLACIRQTEPDAIYVHEQSRLTRGDELEVAGLLREMRERRLKIVIGGVVRDLSSLDERFMVGIQSLVDRAESERIKERQLRGKREKARKGLKNSGIAPFGYRNPPSGDPQRGRLQIVAAEAVIVRRIFGLAAEGHHTRAIARVLNSEGVASPRGGTWGKTTVLRMLTNPVYRGCHVSSGWVAKAGTRTFRFSAQRDNAIVVEDAYPPIIPALQWHKVQIVAPKPRTTKPRMLAGLMSLNGHRATGDSERRTPYYRPPRGVHGGPWITAELADTVVWQAFTKAVSTPCYLERVLADIRAKHSKADSQQEQTAIAAQIAKLEARLTRLLDMRADGEIDGVSFQSRSADTRAQIANLVQRAQRLKQASLMHDGPWIQQMFAAMRVLVTPHNALSVEDRRRVLQQSVRHVAVKARRDAQKQGKNGLGHYQKVSRPPWTIESVTFDLAMGSSDGASCTKAESVGQNPLGDSADRDGCMDTMC
jgi:DNA invertase Pin-like site-specific DNA recombinase